MNKQHHQEQPDKWQQQKRIRNGNLKTQTIKTKRNIKTKRKETNTNKWTTKNSVKQWATQENHERTKNKET